ncbi:TRAP transporter small permease [Martelella alba]|uniref:TRAP transporter small permease protein n=1 Tax=Martelella alba TaxID=2590451 RepID=A0A506UGF2_9HYPH|nr:TRAP transporter small permease [Martelella alba]TPW32405.1 TRAP transporter small permease [Martelella alba]
MLEISPNNPIRRGLDGLYHLAGYLASACLVAMLGVIVAQMVARWSALIFPGGAEYAGYLMAASSFLAFAYALNHGTHIRVNLFLTALGRFRFLGEFWCLAIAAAASTYMAWYAVKLVYWSRKLHDISQGQDATLLWYVQLPVAVGAVLLALAFVDNLVTLILTGQSNIAENPEDQEQAE